MDQDTRARSLLLCSLSLSHIGDSYPYGGLGDKFSIRQGNVFDNSRPAGNRCLTHSSWERGNGVSSHRARALSSWRCNRFPSHTFFLSLYLCKRVSPDYDNPRWCRTRPTLLTAAQQLSAGKCQRTELRDSACTALPPCSHRWSGKCEEKRICGVNRTSPTECTASDIGQGGHRF